MREDFFRELPNTRIHRKAEELRVADEMRCESIGRVACRGGYRLKYRLVSMNCLSEKVIIGDDIKNHAVRQMYQDETLVIPEAKYLRKIRKDSEGSMHEREAVEEGQQRQYNPGKAKERAPVIMIIKLKEETLISQRTRKLSPQETNESQGWINEWIKEGYVRSSTLEFTSPIVMTRKKDGKDMRGLETIE